MGAFCRAPSSYLEIRAKVLQILLEKKAQQREKEGREGKKAEKKIKKIEKSVDKRGMA